MCICHIPGNRNLSTCERQCQTIHQRGCKHLAPFLISKNMLNLTQNQYLVQEQYKIAVPEHNVSKLLQDTWWPILCPPGTVSMVSRLLANLNINHDTIVHDTNMLLILSMIWFAHFVDKRWQYFQVPALQQQ